MPVIVKGKSKPENVLGFFQKKGYEVLSYNPDTLSIVAKKDNKKETFNLGEMVSKLGGELVQADSLNTEETALQESPVSFLNRVKLSFSTQKDRPEIAKKLKSTFTDVKMSKDGTLVVKENGLWKRIDPSGMDVGDIGDMIGYLLPAIGQGIGATIGGTAGTALGLPAGPGAIAVGGAGAVGGGSLGAGAGETVRQGIGSLIGAKKIGLDLPEVGEQATYGALATPLAKGWGTVASGIKTSIPSILSFTTGIPKEVVKFTLENPKVLSGKLGQIKLPSGKLFTMSKEIAGKLIEIRDALGNALSESASALEGTLGNKAIKKQFLSIYKKQIQTGWGGINQLTGDEKALFSSVLKKLPVEKAGEEPIESTLFKLHNLKQYLYDRLEWSPTGETKGNIFLKSLADNLNERLKISAEKLGSNYPALNKQFSQIVEKMKPLGQTPENIYKKINTFLTKTYKGTMTEPEKEILAKATKVVSAPIEGIAKEGAETMAKNKLISESGKAFESWNPHWAPLILASILSGGRTMTQGPGAALGGALGTAATMMPLTIPKLVGLGIQGVSGTSNLLSKYVPQTLQTGAREIVSSPITKNLMGYELMQLLRKAEKGEI